MQRGSLMRTLPIALLTTVLLLPLSSGRAEDAKDRVRRRARHAGETVEHGAKAVGHGAGKVYHNTAAGVHQQIARHAHNRRTKKSNLRGAASHRRRAAAFKKQSDREMDRAKKAARGVGR
jgi:hypothetical protein